MLETSRPSSTGSDLLERSRELAILRAAVDRAAAAGEGASVVIEGIAGIGKTRLIGAASEMAAAQGLRVLSGRGAELEHDLAFGGVRQLFGPLVGQMSAEDRTRAFGGPASLAAPLFDPSIADAATPRDLADPLFGLYWLTVNVAEESPLLLAADDFQWWDEESARFLGYLAQRIEDAPVLLLVATRPHSDTTTDVELASGSSTKLAPEPLSRDAVAKLVVSGLEETFPVAAVDELHRLTGGNPFLVREMTRSLGHDVASALLGDMAGPTTAEMSRTIVERVSRLPGPVKELARAVAVFPDGASLSDAAAVAGLDAEAATDAADALVVAGILAPTDRLDFVHPLIRSAFYEDVAPHARRRAHARAATVLNARGAAVEEVAAHLLASGPLGDASHVEVLLRATAVARQRGALHAAARYLDRALHEPMDDVRRWILRLDLGRIQAVTGVADPESTLRVALDEAPDAEAKAAVAIELAVACYSKTAFDEAVEALLPFRGEQGLSAETSLMLDAMTSFVAWYSERYPQLYVQIADALPEDLEGRTAAERLALCQIGARMFDRCEPHAEVLDVLARSVGDDPAPLAITDMDLGDPISLIIACGDLEHAERICARREAHARSSGRDALFVAARLAAARIAHLRGDLRSAEATLRLALELPGLTAGTASSVRSHLMLVLVEMGQLNEAERLYDGSGEGAGLSASLGDRQRAVLDLASGRPAEAVAGFERSLRFHMQRRSDNPAESTWINRLVTGLAATGRTEEAIQILRDLLPRAEAFGEPRPIGLIHTSLGRVVGGEAAGDHFAAALQALDPSPYRLDAARARLERGAWLRRANLRAEARPLLTSALSELERCGAAADAQRAADELRAAGAKPRRGALIGVDALTPSEERIARLASEGMTNKEIAQHLFVTVKTVEMHLGRAFRKLEIKSRKELPASLR